jgi:hypothetical protein
LLFDQYAPFAILKLKNRKAVKKLYWTCIDKFPSDYTCLETGVPRAVPWREFELLVLARLVIQPCMEQKQVLVIGACARTLCKKHQGSLLYCQCGPFAILKPKNRKTEARAWRDDLGRRVCRVALVCALSVKLQYLVVSSESVQTRRFFFFWGARKA